MEEQEFERELEKLARQMNKLEELPDLIGEMKRQSRNMTEAESRMRGLVEETNGRLAALERQQAENMRRTEEAQAALFEKLEKKEKAGQKKIRSGLRTVKVLVAVFGSAIAALLLLFHFWI